MNPDDEISARWLVLLFLIAIAFLSGVWFLLDALIDPKPCSQYDSKAYYQRCLEQRDAEQWDVEGAGL